MQLFHKIENKSHQKKQRHVKLGPQERKTSSEFHRDYKSIRGLSMFVLVIMLSACVEMFCRSPVFNAMLTSPCTESSTGILILSDTKYDTVNAALHCMYTFEIRGDYAIEVRVTIYFLPTDCQHR